MLLSEKRIKKKINSLESEKEAWLKRAEEAGKKRSVKAKLYKKKAGSVQEKIDKLREKLPEEKPAKKPKRPEKDDDIIQALVDASSTRQELQDNIDDMQSFTPRKLDRHDIVHLGLEAKKRSRNKFGK